MDAMPNREGRKDRLDRGCIGIDERLCAGRTPHLRRVGESWGKTMSKRPVAKSVCLGIGMFAVAGLVGCGGAELFNNSSGSHSTFGIGLVGGYGVRGNGRGL